VLLAQGASHARRSAGVLIIPDTVAVEVVTVEALLVDVVSQVGHGHALRKDLVQIGGAAVARVTIGAGGGCIHNDGLSTVGVVG
jgi:hypothetical protein